ncbi:MAG: nucleotidyltransferase domain-containing protein [Dechloromonas sp.]|nr:nucleotidyltransferase domain-containing protein [Dechloromonas sp.]
MPDSKRYHQPMRLSENQRNLLQDTIHRHFGADAVTYIFGSRLDDSARGGDMDVFVETPISADYRLRARALAQLEALLALPVDLIVKDAEDRERSIHRIARLSGKRLS